MFSNCSDITSSRRHESAHSLLTHTCTQCSRKFRRADLLLRHQKYHEQPCDGQASLTKKAEPSDTLTQKMEEDFFEPWPANIPNMPRTPSPAPFYDASSSGSSVGDHSDSPLASVDETMPNTTSRGTLQPKPEHLTVKSYRKMTQTTSFTEDDIGSVVSIDEDINSIADSLDYARTSHHSIKVSCQIFPRGCGAPSTL